MMKCIIVYKLGTSVFSIILKDYSGQSIDDTIIAAKLFCGSMYEKMPLERARKNESVCWGWWVMISS